MELAEHFLTAVATSEKIETPFPHWILRDCLSDDVLEQVIALPFTAMDINGVSGERALHNDKRVYFEPDTRYRFRICDSIAGMFQDPRIVSRLEKRFGANLRDSFLRIEYAQDTDGFWLEPHTDIGAKLFSMLLYVSRDQRHHSLGTDIYDSDKVRIARIPFLAGNALVFIPSQRSFHGFEARSIAGVRKSLIINYVTQQWRARDELAFPDTPIIPES